jgi:hypothetical protein
MSEKHSHTPGPWNVGTIDWSVDGNVRYELTGIDVITQADARLIEAAPDLLAALRWYVENDDTNIGMEGNEFWEEGLECGKAALAKATGA